MSVKIKRVTFFVNVLFCTESYYQTPANIVTTKQVLAKNSILLIFWRVMKPVLVSRKDQDWIEKHATYCLNLIFSCVNVAF